MAMTVALQAAQPLPSSSSSSCLQTHNLFFHPQRYIPSSLKEGLRTRLGNLCLQYHSLRDPNSSSIPSRRRNKTSLSVGRDDIEQLSVQEPAQENEENEEAGDDEGEVRPTPQELQFVQEIKRVLELLRKNRDMLFNEVKLTVMIEDPREVERRRLLGIEDPDAPTRDDLVEALEQVNEGKIPKNRIALQMLAEEMINWPNLEVESAKTKPSKSLYAKATDTGVDPREAAKRLEIDWDSAAEIEEADTNNDTDVPPAVVCSPF
uniref:Uncharacterized protein LOC105113655 n=1 Tax=Rhizophora mucronata TaxID=61149 RepID=A0A2P2JZY2_RHIMU